MSEDPNVAELIDLVVHDLRNPVATVGANLSYVRDAIRADGDPDLREAFDDMSIALRELMTGLEQLGTVGRALSGRVAAEPTRCDLERCVEGAVSAFDGVVHHTDGSAEVLGGPPLTRLVQLLVRNSKAHGRGACAVRTRVEAELGILEVEDRGVAIAEVLREVAFTIAGQHQLKSRADGRYSRNVGLVAAAAHADAIGARLIAAGEDGAALFRVELPVLPPV